MPSEAARQVIPFIHDAALDPRRWQAVSDALAAAVDGVRIHLMFFDAANPGAEVMMVTGYDPAMIGKFNEYYGAVNPWRAGLLRHPLMAAVTSEQMLPHAELVRTEFHADWLRPQGDISAGAGMILQQDPRRVLVVGGHVRMRDQDRLERTWQNLANELAPALRHAVEVNRALAGLRLENRLLVQGLRPAGASVVVLSDDLRILHANEAACHALSLLAGASGANRLSLRDPRAQEALEDALRRTRHGTAPPVALRIADPVTRTSRIAHLLRAGPDVLPFAGLDPVRRSIPESVAVLVLPATDGAEVLMRHFGLTRAEAEVALALHSGRTLAEIAGDRGASPHTVRSQSKAILAKCGVRRQAELVGLIGRMLQ